MATSTCKPLKLCNEYLEGKHFTVVDRHQKIGSEPVEVIMKLDPNGLIIYWDFVKSKQRKFVFMDCVVDVRVGKENPKEMTIVCNKDYISLSAMFFTFEGDQAVVKKWSDQLFKLAYSHKKQYRSVLRDMNRLFAPLRLDGNSKYENAYEHLNSSYKSVISKFAIGSSIKSISTTDDVINAYLEKVPRPELEELFNEISKGKPTLTAEDFTHFLNYTQRDDRLNEEIFPFLTPKRTLKLIDEIEPGQIELSYQGFLRFLLGDWTTDLDTVKQRAKVEDMIHPICHYFINSSHNTYLNGNQIHAAKALATNRHPKAETDVEMYRQILLGGCRCVEIDCWDGPTGPIVTHGPLSLQQINTVPLKDVCEAIMDAAFKSSEYPVILSLENHCSPPQQQQMAEMFVEVFGDHLLSSPLESNPLQKGTLPPSPHTLKNKILLKGSKTKGIISAQKLGFSLRRHVEKFMDEVDKLTGSGLSNADEYMNKRETTADEEIDSNVPRNFYLRDVAVASVETRSALADQINYFQTTPILNYDDPEYLMHSGSEHKIDKIITKRSTEFIQHTARHTVRVYPDIRRIDSSNFLPMYFWTAGCQMTALNFQTTGLPMQMNETLFEENSQCGYVLKSLGLRQISYKLSVHDTQMFVSHKLEIEILSGQLLNLLMPSKKETCKTTVFVDLYDLPNDTVIDQFQTSEERRVGFNTMYAKNKFVFPKIIKPEHSLLHVRVIENETGEEIGQRFLPVHKMVAGYRHIILRNRANRSEGPASIFAKIRTEIFVPAHQKELRENFKTPLKALKEQEEMRMAFANPMLRAKSIQKKDESIESTKSSPSGSVSSSDSMSKKSTKSS